MKTAYDNCLDFAQKAITGTFSACATVLLAGCATGVAPRLHQAAADGKLDIVQAEVSEAPM